MIQFLLWLGVGLLALAFLAHLLGLALSAVLWLLSVGIGVFVMLLVFAVVKSGQKDPS
jgi:hypothetical protein